MKRPTIWRFVGSLAALFWLGFAIAYIASDRPPYSFYSDLGADILNYGQMGAVVTSLPNLLATLGWATWVNWPSFNYTGMLEYYLALPVQLICGNPFRTVKFVQVVEATLAFWGAGLLYGYLFGRSKWRWFCAAVYTIVPISAFWFRHNAGYGWIVALVPLALVLGLEAARRYGSRSFALIGVLTGIATFAFGLEFVFFVAPFMIVFSIVAAKIKHGVCFSYWHIAGAFCSLGLFVAYVALPTLFDPKVQSFIASRQSSDYTLSLFAQTPLDYLGLIMPGYHLSPDWAQNANASLPVFWFGGTLLWILAGAGLAYAIRQKTLRAVWPALALWVFFVAVSFGLGTPFFGPAFWKLMSALPLLSDLRTPERFAQITPLVIAIGAAYGASRLWSKGTFVRWSTGAAIVVALFAFALSDVREHVFALGSFEDRLPGYSSISPEAQKLGGRSVTLGFPRGGSTFDYPPYAPENLGLSYAWNLAGRFDDLGVPLLRRADVRTVVTTPLWVVNPQAGMPLDMAIPIRGSRLVRELGPYSQGADAFAISNPRQMISPAVPVCVLGGVDGFERAAGEPLLDAAVLLRFGESGERCRRTVLADGDALDAVLPEEAVATWSGATAFGSGEELPSAYKWVIDRMEIAVPWYQRSYYGDAAIATPFATRSEAATKPGLSYKIRTEGDYALYVRASGTRMLATLDSAGRLVTANSQRQTGFAWVKLPLGHLVAGSYDVNAEVMPPASGPDSDAAFFVVDAMLVAPANVGTVALATDSIVLSGRSFSPGTAVGRPWTYVFPRLQRGELSAKAQGIGSPKALVGLFDGQPQARIADPMGTLPFAWPGPTGRYAIEAAAWLNGLVPRIELNSSGGRFSASYDSQTGVNETQALGFLTLRHGEPLNVILNSLDGSPGALTQLIGLPVTSAETPTGYSDKGETWTFDASNSLPMFEALHAQSVSFFSGSARAPVGTIGSVPFTPSVAGAPVVATVHFTGSSGGFSLRCGAENDTLRVGAVTTNATDASLLVMRRDLSPCVLHVMWYSADFGVQSVHIQAFGTSAYGWKARQYFADGTYTWTAGPQAPTLLVDGSPWSPNASVALRAGFHDLSLVRSAMPIQTLRFTRRGSWPLPAPPGVNATELTSSHWLVKTAGPATLELAQLDDGNWLARSSAGATSGYRCDLVNTCFDVASAGVVDVNRRPPIPLVVGFLVTGADVVLAVLLLFWPRRSPPRDASRAL